MTTRLPVPNTYDRTDDAASFESAQKNSACLLYGECESGYPIAISYIRPRYDADNAVKASTSGIVAMALPRQKERLPTPEPGFELKKECFTIQIKL